MPPVRIGLVGMGEDGGNAALTCDPSDLSSIVLTDNAFLCICIASKIWSAFFGLFGPFGPFGPFVHKICDAIRRI